MPIRLRKSPRLQGFDYVGVYAYSLAFVTGRRAPLFREAETVELVEATLVRACARQAFVLRAYCFVPDHLHVLVAGGPDSRLHDLVRLFKQLAGYAYKQRLG